MGAIQQRVPKQLFFYNEFEKWYFMLLPHLQVTKKLYIGKTRHSIDTKYIHFDSSFPPPPTPLLKPEH